MANPSIVDAHMYRTKTRGLDLGKHIQTAVNQGGILASWNSTPAGFKFAVKDLRALNLDLAINVSFAADTSLGQRFQTGASWREVGRSDSLHLVLYGNGYEDTLKTRLDYANVHLDSVSPVAGSSSGKCIYNGANVVQHVLTDLWHTRLIARGTNKGPMIGFRF